MDNLVKFPECFSEAPYKLRMKFRKLDPDTIEDGVQNARIEYWCQNIQKSIPDENEAYGWFLNVAYRYLYKEIERSNRLSSLSDAANELIADDFGSRFIYRDLLDSLKQKLSPMNATIMFEHAMGYSLKELASSGNISLDAVKQRHARERRALKRQSKHFFQ